MADLQLEFQLTLLELSRAAGASEEEVLALVVEGVLEPLGARPDEWLFTSASLARAQTAHRLSRDLGLNVAGIALALELLNEIEALKARLAGIRVSGEEPPITIE